MPRRAFTGCDDAGHDAFAAGLDGETVGEFVHAERDRFLAIYFKRTGGILVNLYLYGFYGFVCGKFVFYQGGAFPASQGEAYRTVLCIEGVTVCGHILLDKDRALKL